MKLNKLIKTPNFSKSLFKKKRRSFKVKYPNEVVAIDIGTFALKLVEVQLRPIKVIKRLVYYPWQTPIPHKDVTEIVTSPNFYKEIASILETNKIKSKNIIILAANNKLVMRPMKFPPNLNDTEVKQLLDLQLEEHIPYDEDQVYFDYHIVKRDGKETLIHVFASEKEYIDELVEIFKSLKRKIHCINVSPVAMYNIASQYHGTSLADTELFVTVNIGASLTELCIFKNNELLLFRTIPIAGNKFTNAFAVDEALIINNAEFQKCEYGLQKAMQMESVLIVQNELFDQLWRSIQYIIARNKSYALKKVYLSGGSANIKGLNSKFRRFIEIQMLKRGETRSFEVEMLNPFYGFELADGLDLLELNDIAASFASVMGLVCGGV